MYRSVLAGFLFAALFGFVHMKDVVNGPNFRCTPGTVFMDDCNTCRCAKDGRTAGCTFILCPPGGDRKRRDVEQDSLNPLTEELPQVEEDSTIIKRAVKKCTPGQRFKVSCNTCTCNKGGDDFFCTEKKCFENPIDIEKIVCPPEQDFKVGCNTCVCNEDGSDYICASNNCEHIEEAVKICDPGTEKQEDCNSCFCNDAGTEYVCTEKKCNVDDDIPQLVCTPGSKVTVDCNTCICNAFGKDFICTKKKCPQGVDNSAVASRLCRPLSIFKELCNTCRCNLRGTKATCTTKNCGQ